MDIEATLSTARRLIRDGDSDGLLRLMETAIRDHPHDAEIRLMTATALLPFRPEEAAAHIEEAVAIQPTSAHVLARAASMMFYRRHFEAAQDYGERAARIAPHDQPVAREMANILGKIAGMQGRLEVAEEALRAAAEDGPPDADYTYDLANFLAQTSRSEEALKAIDDTIGAISDPTELLALRTHLRSDA